MIGLNRADSILTTIWNILQESGDFTWRVTDCEELVGEVNHTTECVTDLFSFVDVEWIIL